MNKLVFIKKGPSFMLINKVSSILLLVVAIITAQACVLSAQEPTVIQVGDEVKVATGLLLVAPVDAMSSANAAVDSM